MRTVRTKVYQFNELNESAKQTAIDNYRNNNLNFDFVYSDMHNTIKKFNDVFDIREGSRSWLDFSTSHFENEILSLSGLRLHKYLINNYFYDLFKGKYYSLWSKKDFSFEHYKDGFPVLKQRRSKVIFENCCVLTGMCYDENVLQPIYDFLKHPDKNTGFEGLISECFQAAKKCIDDEIDYMNSDEYITEEIGNNDFEFTKDGNRF